MDKFYRDEPTARTSWRQAVLMGANTRTYKFALGQALLQTAQTGDHAPLLSDLAARYAWELIRRAQHFPQARTAELGTRDFLTVLAEEAPTSVAAGTATDRLVAEAVRSMPGMVMDKFHNLRDTGTVPHRFYEIRGTGPSARVTLTPDLYRLVGEPDTAVLLEELATRWSIVEASFDAGIGPSLVNAGFVIDRQSGVAWERQRRRPVARLRPTLSGFQHGRCLYCGVLLIDLEATAHVEHVFPFHWMNRLNWAGPDLDSLWNLVLLCPTCNGDKLGNRPTVDQVQALIDRNDAILRSPHPLRRTLQLSLSLKRGRHDLGFYRAVDVAGVGA